MFRFVLYELRLYIQAGQVLLYWMVSMYFGGEEYRDRLLVGKQTHECENWCCDFPFNDYDISFCEAC